jgi:hypothetical protein
VVENTCTETMPFTYRMDGPNATYLGVGDLHDRKYSHYQRTSTSTISDLVSHHHDHVDGKSYTALPLNPDHCKFSFHVYPSRDMVSSKF